MPPSQRGAWQRYHDARIVRVERAPKARARPLGTSVASACYPRGRAQARESQQGALGHDVSERCTKLVEDGEVSDLQCAEQRLIPLSPKIDGSKTIGVRGRRRWSSRMSCGPRGRSSSIQVLVSDGEDRRRLETSRSRRAFLYTGRSAALVRCGEAHRQRRSPRLQKFLTDPGPCQSCAPVTDQGGERGATSESAEASWRVLESKIGRRASPGASMRWLVHTPDMYTMTAKG